jgi:hypothetical protein
MDRSSRFGAQNAEGESPKDVVLLALVVGVMSAVNAEACKCQQANCEARELLAKLPSPNAGLSPQQVVKVQLSALKLAAHDSSGFAKAFEFASPTARAIAGPVERFTLLVQSPIYYHLVGFNEVRVGMLQVIGEEAEQLVSLSTPNQQSVKYRFRLALQQQGDFAGCWMTELVERI